MNRLSQFMNAKTKSRIRVEHKRLNLSKYDLDGKTLEELILYLKHIHQTHEKEGFNHDLECFFHIEQYYDETDIYLLFTRWETNDEYDKRQAKNKAAREGAAKGRAKQKEKAELLEKAKSEQEYKEFLKLKEKYESPKPIAN